MAFHAGAELANLECYQINPLIKDYNGPACAYVTGPFGGYTANNRGQRFIECDYWSGQMMLEFWRELQSGSGPVFLKLDHLAEETISEIETILHSNERPSRGRFHEARGTNYRQRMIEMHISEVGFCSGHSASGVWVNERAETTVPGLYAAGDMASVPHNYMLGAFVNGGIAGATAADYCVQTQLLTYDAGDIAREQERVLAPTKREDGLTPHEMEFKTRRLVNDYIQPPKVTAKYLLAQERFAEVREDLSQLVARDPHELMRGLELQSILDCADMAAAASLYRTESRWGLYHLRVDYPETDNDNWFCHTMLSKDASGRIAHRKRPIDPYIVPVDETEMSAYHQLRIKTPVAAE
jgi:succinate dehydrogenase/fumarate reductase flavoprotein subunit